MITAVNIHATCVMLGATSLPFGGPSDGAVLILGPPGSGKSDLALRLIAAGGVLVADDRTLLTVENGLLCAMAPEAIRGGLEVRGAGIIMVPFAPRAAVTLAVELLDTETPERLPPETQYQPPAPLPFPQRFVPLIGLRAFETSAVAKIAAIASAAAKERFVAGVAPGKSA